MQPIRPATTPSGHHQTLAADHLHLPGIRVTERWFIVGQRRFDLTELHNLRTVRGSHHPMAVRTVTCAIAGMVLIGLFFKSLAPVGLMGAVGAVVILAGLAKVIAWCNPRSYEMWAEYRGMTIQLYYSDNERHYGTVSRALIRSRERAWLRSVPACDYSAAATQTWYTQAA
jgi:hypothetical protein